MLKSLEQVPNKDKSVYPVKHLLDTKEKNYHSVSLKSMKTLEYFCFEVYY